LDQLPVLRQLARVLDEMSLGVDNAAAAAAAAGSNSDASRLILEQVGGHGLRETSAGPVFFAYFVSNLFLLHDV
jgi:hypothetical protein